jgi:hypothetical protein
MKISLLVVTVIILYGCENSQTQSSREFDITRPLFTDDSTIYILTRRKDGANYTYKGKDTIDIETLKQQGEYLIDRHRVYNIYEIEDETLILTMEGIDKSSFHVLEYSMYAKDKNHVYSRNGIIDNADVATFEAVRIKNKKTGSFAYGRDKKNYYFWDQIVTDTIGFGEIIRKHKQLKVKQ